MSPDVTRPVQAQSDERVLAAIGRLETWYAYAQRAMPWRIPPIDPPTAKRRDANHRGYVALVSELMLQQTQVARVLESFDRFMIAFPDIHALAAASEDDVLAAWQGLGYYRRARLLHAAAKAVVDDHAGVFPTDVKTLLTLPGVGRYTAGAIASTAFGHRAPIVDGNVARVLSRFNTIAGSPQSSSTQKTLWALATLMVDACDDPSEFNQSLMELGATICTPRSPSCTTCPIAEQCLARATDRVREFPEPKAAIVRTTIHCASFVMVRGDCILLVKRPSTGMWANMWQVPTLESTKAITSAMCRRFLKESISVNVSLKALTSAGSFVHETTHRRMSFTSWRVGLAAEAEPVGGTWVDLDSLASHALSNAQQRVVSMSNPGRKAEAADPT